MEGNFFFKYINQNSDSQFFIKIKNKNEIAIVFRPKAGSLTAMRGHKARSHVTKELLELCEIISDNGEHLEDGTVGIVFGELFKVSIIN